MTALRAAAISRLSLLVLTLLILAAPLHAREWYVDAAASGDGSAAAPFATLAAAERASAAGDTIEVRGGTYGETITLKERQTLIGAARPKIARVVLAPDSSVRGVAAAAVSGRELQGSVTLQDVEAQTLSLAAQLGAFRWSGGSGATVDLDGGNGDVSIENVAIRQESGTAVRVANRSGGAVAFGAGSTVTVIAGRAEGIVLTSNTGNISFAAPVTIATTGVSALRIQSCDSVAMAGGTLSTSGAPALQVSATKLTLNLDRVEASGAESGIVLDHTSGTATLRAVRVTRSSGSAILLRDASGVRLEELLIDAAAREGIEAERVEGLVLSDGELRGCGLAFKDVTGNVAIIRTKVLEHAVRGLNMKNGGGETSLLIDGSTFRGGRGEHAAQGVLIDLRGTAKLAARIEDSTFTDNFSNAIHLSASETASADVSLRGCTFRDNNAAAVLVAAGEATLRYRIASNREITGHTSAPIVINSSSKREVSGIVEDNVIRAEKAGSSGVVLIIGGAGAFFATVRGNTVERVAGSGIRVDAGGAGDARIAVTGNTIRDPQPNALAGISVMTSSRSADTVKLCADIRDNTISGGWEAPIAIGNRGAAATFRLAGYRNGSVASWLTARNHGAAVTPTLRTAAPATVFTGADACTIPAP